MRTVLVFLMFTPMTVLLDPGPRTSRFVPPGHLYHGVFPGSASGEEDSIAPEDVSSYEAQVGKSVAWVYFSNNWFRERNFPLSEATWIRNAGSVPFIRLMMRSDLGQRHPEPIFTLERIVTGAFDHDLRLWARQAADFQSPVFVEFGTEVNTDWFPWNGVWNHEQTDGRRGRDHSIGPDLFRKAYRHIIAVSRQEGARNISWVFHVNNRDEPAAEWNRFENYYPGDSWIDYVGVSVYGAQTPVDPDWPSFRSLMDEVYPRLVSLSKDKPILLAEFGATSGNPHGDQADWAEVALTDLMHLRWPRVAAFSWWNGAWTNDSDTAHNSDMRIQDNPRLAEVFRRLIARNPRVLGTLEVTGWSSHQQSMSMPQR